MKKGLIAGVFLLALSGCGGYDEEACYQSAADFMESVGGEAHLIPGESWTYLGTTTESVFFLEAMNLSNCDITKSYKVVLE